MAAINLTISTDILKQPFCFKISGLNTPIKS